MALCDTEDEYTVHSRFGKHLTFYSRAWLTLNHKVACRKGRFHPYNFKHLLLIVKEFVNQMNLAQSFAYAGRQYCNKKMKDLDS